MIGDIAEKTKIFQIRNLILFKSLNKIKAWIEPKLGDFFLLPNQYKLKKTLRYRRKKQKYNKLKI